jgi:hypothetical protein
VANQYISNWKTGSWGRAVQAANRQAPDGTIHPANFNFFK